jgi:nucleoside-diphosphate-sugar epimerase
MTKRKVLLTGASGSMGSEAFKELIRMQEKYDIVLLLQPSRRKNRYFKKYEHQSGIEIVWGDLCNQNDVLRAVKDIDFVLHTAALIPPAADCNPQLCSRVNFDGTKNLISAVLCQPNKGGNIRFVYISSVAVYGDRLPPFHIVEVGEPLRPSVGDFYATTKMAAEKEVIESDLKYWAVLRQTYIAIRNAMTLLDPIMFHQPLNTHIELITNQDAGYGLVKTLEAPDDFYGKVYNMSGGPSCRVIYEEYLERMMKIFHLGDYRKIMDPKWFALRNFHCCWYADSHILNEYLGHWRHSLEDHYTQVEEALHMYAKWSLKALPSSIVRGYLKRMADPLKWIKNDEVEKIDAFFGSREAWENIQGWAVNKPSVSSLGEPRKSKSQDIFSIDELREIALSRGGRCLSKEYFDMKTKMRWKCSMGHEWEATGSLIKAGHWCPNCAPPPWDYGSIAKTDPLMAKYYYINHTKDENQKSDCLFDSSEWRPKDEGDKTQFR